MTSDIKLPHYFLLIKVKYRRVLNTEIIQKEISKHYHWMQGNFDGWVHITANCFYFNSNVLKFELQYDWTPPQIFFCRHHVSQLFCHNVEGAHDIKWNWNFADFKCFYLSLPANFRPLDDHMISQIKKIN